MGEEEVEAEEQGEEEIELHLQIKQHNLKIVTILQTRQTTYPTLHHLDQLGFTWKCHFYDDNDK